MYETKVISVSWTYNIRTKIVIRTHQFSKCRFEASRVENYVRVDKMQK